MRVRIIFILISLFLGVSLAAAGFEIYLRLTRPGDTFGVARELPWMRRNRQDLSRVFTTDPAFGFRPILDGRLYSEFGTLVNNYPIERRPGVMRLLFIGDSVTARGKLVESLKKVYGMEQYEYWNAGVESFNTLQEIAYYRAFNRKIRPDHVILTFIYNDLGTTPIAFFDDNNRLTVYSPSRPRQRVNFLLFQHSHAYRWFLAYLSSRQEAEEDIYRDIKSALTGLKEELEREGIVFTVIILPKLKPREKWKEWEHRTRELIGRLMDESQVLYFDLFEPALEALADGTPGGERPHDHWHPGEEIAARLAAYLQQQGLLAPPPRQEKTSRSGQVRR